MSEEELDALRRGDHVAIAAIGGQLTALAIQVGAIQTSVDRSTKRVEELEAIVRAGTWTVRFLGMIGGFVMTVAYLWPTIRAWLKSQMQ